VRQRTILLAVPRPGRGRARARGRRRPLASTHLAWVVLLLSRMIMLTMGMYARSTLCVATSISAPKASSHSATNSSVQLLPDSRMREEMRRLSLADSSEDVGRPNKYKKWPASGKKHVSPTSTS